MKQKKGNTLEGESINQSINRTHETNQDKHRQLKYSKIHNHCGLCKSGRVDEHCVNTSERNGDRQRAKQSNAALHIAYRGRKLCDFIHI